MLSAKIFLLVMGVLYLLLALWCILKPDATSEAVGFRLTPGSGQSEYLAVYGGLQLGMGLFFLLPLLRGDFILPCLLGCTLIHAAIVLCRTVGFFLYANIAPTTRYLAGVEWAILTSCVFFWWWSQRGE